MQVGKYRFQPRLWAVLLYLAVAAVMLMLGYWQLQRADEKIALQATAERARRAAPVAVQTIEDPVRAARMLRRVDVVGVVATPRHLLWDNRTHRGRAGYEVITPVRVGDGRLALVNRGWVPPGPSRAELPEVPMAGDCLQAPLQGLFSRPSQGFMSGPAVQDSDTWPRTVQYFDYPAIERALGEPVIAGIVQLQVADADSHHASAEDTSSAPCLFRANWQPAASGPERHYSYAFQWFAMALGLTVLFVVVNSTARPAGLAANARDDAHAGNSAGNSIGNHE